MSMKLKELIYPFFSNTKTEEKKLINDKLNKMDYLISGITNDSRQINKGFAFFAYPGSLTDGRSYISQAIKAGAIAIIYEPLNNSLPLELPTNIVGIPIPQLAKKLSLMVSKFYKEPSKKLSITGVTGTNGKTTITYQLAMAYSLLNEPASYVGTLGHGNIFNLNSLSNTTPDAFCLQKLLADYQQQNIKQILMEVSSHALAQHRTDGIDFQQAIFTNISRDHLDYHKTLKAYAKAKSMLFTNKSLKTAIINADDPYHKDMLAVVPPNCQIFTYSVENLAQNKMKKNENLVPNIHAFECNIHFAGTDFQIKSPWGIHQIHINLLGRFNIYNSLAVFLSLLNKGYAISKVIDLLSKLKAPPGRMEIISSTPCIIVDYAHTPDALKNVLLTLQEFKNGKILVVFGCGGERDTVKRGMMGKIAVEMADVVIITNDNPRHENPLNIMQDILSGVFAAKKSSKFYTLYQIEDRALAIDKAISLAEKSDIILVSGKGHESYQQIGNQIYKFSDQTVIKNILNLN